MRQKLIKTPIANRVASQTRSQRPQTAQGRGVSSVEKAEEARSLLSSSLVKQGGAALAEEAKTLMQRTRSAIANDQSRAAGSGNGYGTQSMPRVPPNAKKDKDTDQQDKKAPPEEIKTVPSKKTSKTTSLKIYTQQPRFAMNPSNTQRKDGMSFVPGGTEHKRPGPIKPGLSPRVDSQHSDLNQSSPSQDEVSSPTFSPIVIQPENGINEELKLEEQVIPRRLESSAEVPVAVRQLLFAPEAARQQPQVRVAPEEIKVSQPVERPLGFHDMFRSPPPAVISSVREGRPNTQQSAASSVAPAAQLVVPKPPREPGSYSVSLPSWVQQPPSVSDTRPQASPLPLFANPQPEASLLARQPPAEDEKLEPQFDSIRKKIVPIAVEDIQCLVCMEVTESAKTTTCCGAVVCDQCVPRVERNKCPQCRHQPLLMIENKFLLRLLSNFGEMCSCGAEVKRKDKEAHKLICQKRVFACPCGDFRGKPDAFKSHLLQKHKREILKIFLRAVN